MCEKVGLMRKSQVKSTICRKIRSGSQAFPLIVEYNGGDRLSEFHMPYHVPFNQRNRKPGAEPPVYIGFDHPAGKPSYYRPLPHQQMRPIYYSGQMAPVRRRFNGSGFTGLLLSILSPFTAFLLAPVALLFSLRGLRRAPRGMAFFGTMFSLVGTAILGFAIMSGVQSHQRQKTAHLRAHAQRVLHEQKSITTASLESAANELLKYRELNDGLLPDGVQGNVITIQFADAWKKELRYEPGEKQAMIRSAGPDGKFETKDDMVTSVKGVPQYSIFSSASQDP